jgi:hypothetical protein
MHHKSKWVYGFSVFCKEIDINKILLPVIIALLVNGFI